MSKGISRLNRNFDDYKKALIDLSKTYYPDMATTFDDASVASWLIDLIASIADNESYHIDRAYQETNIDDAQERSSLLAIARNNGVKVPGPKGSMAEIELSCIVPGGDEPDFTGCPVIKKGSVFASATQKFELLYDVDFRSQFDYYNESDRTLVERAKTDLIYKYFLGYDPEEIDLIDPSLLTKFRREMPLKQPKKLLL